MADDNQEDDLKRLKLEVKSWEYTFKKENGRQPSKEDIKKNPDIQQKYKLYRKLKAQGSSTTAVTTPKKPKTTQPEIEASPEITGVGPTPQLHGRVLGLFDVMSTPTKSSMSPEVISTPTKSAVVENTPVKNQLNTPAKSSVSPVSETPAYLHQSVVSFSPLAPRRVKRGLSSLIAELREMREEDDPELDDDDMLDKENEDAELELDHLGEQRIEDADDEDKDNPFAVKKYRKKGQKRSTRRHVFKPVVTDQDRAEGVVSDSPSKKQAKPRTSKPTENFRRLKINNSGFKTRRFPFKRR